MNRNNIICFALLIVTGANAGCISSPESTAENDTVVTGISADKVLEIHRPQEPEKPYPYNEEEVVYENRRWGQTRRNFDAASFRGSIPFCNFDHR